MKDIINVILNDLKNKKVFVNTIKRCTLKELSDFHFGMGLYIRNKFLWNDKENYIYLSKYYNETDIDKISQKILEELYYIVRKSKKTPGES